MTETPGGVFHSEIESDTGFLGKYCRASCKALSIALMTKTDPAQEVRSAQAEHPAWHELVPVIPECFPEVESSIIHAQHKGCTT